MSSMANWHPLLLGSQGEPWEHSRTGAQWEERSTAGGEEHIRRGAQ